MIGLSKLQVRDSSDAMALDAETYTCEEFYALETKEIFESTWQLVAHTSQIENIGDQIVCQIGKIPILLVRNQEGILKAFHNVCRHRAGPLASNNINNKVLRCQYHGWTYDLNGQLKSAPEMNTSPNFEVCQYHLPKAYVSVWHDFIFVCVSKNPLPLEEIVKDIAEKIAPINLSQMEFSHRNEYLVECNWKVYMDNYLEGYHLPHIHPGLSKLLDYRNYDTELNEWYSYQYSPLDSAENNSAEIFYGEGNAHYFCIFPNLMLNILPGRLQTNVILAEGVDKTRVIFDYYYSNLDSEKTQKLVQQDQSFSDEVQLEDNAICEKVQVGLKSGSYQAGPLCIKRELGVLHFQNLLRRSINTALTRK